MAERREDSAVRTERPNGLDSVSTVRDILGLAAVTAGRPQLLAGEHALDTTVRWVHVSDSAAVARMLEGGELLLSTGSAWPADADALRAFITGLADVGVAALVLELGSRYADVPAIVVDTARAHGLPLVALHREVKFVTITEAVHRRVIAEQTAALRARVDVRDRFAQLALRGSPADVVVHQLAQLLAAPIVLENLAHEVIVADVPPASESHILARWDLRSRLAHRGDAIDGEAWTIVPVEARGIRWGHLVALPGTSGTAASGVVDVMRQAATALAIGRLAAPGVDEWAAIGRRRLLDGLLGGRYVSPAAAAVRVEAAGMPVDGATLRGIVITGAAVDPELVDAAAVQIGGRALAAAAGTTTTVLLSLPPRTVFDEAAAARLLAAIGGTRLSATIGAGGTGIDAGLRSVQEASDLARTIDPGSAPVVRWADRRPLARLVSALRDDHRVLDHGERMLAPLIQYDLQRRGDLLDVLGAMLAHPGNRTAAANASHLSRSVFYQRIALIDDLLDVDLDDGEVQAALHLALLVHRSAGR